MAGNELEPIEAVTNDKELEMGLAIRGNIVLGGLVEQLQVQRSQVVGEGILDALGAAHGFVSCRGRDAQGCLICSS